MRFPSTVFVLVCLFACSFYLLVFTVVFRENASVCWLPLTFLLKVHCNFIPSCEINKKIKNDFSKKTKKSYWNQLNP